MTKTNTQGATSRPAVDPQQSSKGTTLHYSQNTTNPHDLEAITFKEAVIAVMRITDDFTLIMDKAEKIAHLLDVMKQGYFERFNSDKQEDLLGIAVGFNRNGVYANIAFDYIKAVQDELQELDKKTSLLWRRMRQGEPPHDTNHYQPEGGSR